MIVNTLENKVRNYDRFPKIAAGGRDQIRRGWAEIAEEIGAAARRCGGKGPCARLIVETYTGLHDAEVVHGLKAGLPGAHWLFTRDIFLPEDRINALMAPFLGGEDPLFGVYAPLSMEQLLDAELLNDMRRRMSGADGLVIVYGPGAWIIAKDADGPANILIYADMPRWEGQLRQRRGEVGNLGLATRETRASLAYKRSFFADWRICDGIKRDTMARWDYLLDTTVPADPKLITGNALRKTLGELCSRPFRLIPFFDPAPWGGQWMKRVCGLDPRETNYGWCFDCVPEENSLLLDFSGALVEIPALNLVFYQPEELLGSSVHRRFGAEFPIRFDLLDTMGGGNLSLQVHPTEDFARRHFGLGYTQDESYYMLDAGPAGAVFLGFKEAVDRAAMLRALRMAQRAPGAVGFSAEQFVNRWPAKKHDHFLIPAGTIHCSGAETMVLEISATPYIFTFKLWDWGRLGLDGLPRPLNVDRGEQVLQWQRDKDWVHEHLINNLQPLAAGPGWREERTGLHASQFIETRRHWFTGPTPHPAMPTVQVLNLVQGREAVVESPDHAFAPMAIHYAETFVVPARAGPYVIRPVDGCEDQPCATVKAFVRE